MMTGNGSDAGRILCENQDLFVFWIFEFLPSGPD
jgi:hypothetical protein